MLSRNYLFLLLFIFGCELAKSSVLPIAAGSGKLICDKINNIRMDTISSVVIDSNQSADVLKSDGISAESQEQFELAARAFEEAVKAFKVKQIIDTVCVFRAGFNYVHIEQYEKAIPFLQECIELNYNIGRTSRLLSDAYIGLKNIEKAESVLLTGKNNCPEEEVEFDKKLAYLYFNSRQYEKAALEFEYLNVALPGNKKYMYLYGFSLERTNKFERAIAIFESMLELFPDDKKSKKMLGIVYFRQTEVLNEKEVKQYEAKKNASVEDYVATKRNLENINRGYEKARVIMEESLIDYPNDKQIISSLYAIYKKQSKEDKAARMKEMLK